MPLFYGDGKKMQTRVQLIDARDSNGNRLPKAQSYKLLKAALRMQKTDVQIVIMPPMSSHQTFNLINSLNNATTLAYGKTSHKVTREYTENNDNLIMTVGHVDLKPRSPRERQMVDDLCSTVNNHQLSNKERELRIKLLVSKLNSVISKRIERTKVSAFHEIKVHSVKSQSLERYDLFSPNTTNLTGAAKDKLLRMGTDSEFKRTQCTNYKYSTNPMTNEDISESYNVNSHHKKKGSLHPFSTSLMGEALRKEQLSFKNNIGLAIALTPTESFENSKHKSHEIKEEINEN